MTSIFLINYSSRDEHMIGFDLGLVAVARVWARLFAHVGYMS
jgi:hypothetical protein